MRHEAGQASVEWIGSITLIVVVLGAGLVAMDGVDGRSLGGTLAHKITCAAKRPCADADSAIRHAYGHTDAALVRRHLPGLVYEPGERQVPVDWRVCRATRCALAPDDRGLDTHRTTAGNRVTVFTRLLRRGGRRYVQYWLYYPDSNTAWGYSDRIWRHSRLLQLLGLASSGSTEYPGYHRDDWEAVAVAIDPDGRSGMRATSHGHWQWCKWRSCKGEWGPSGGWSRVSRGSHAGHVPVDSRGRLLVPGAELNERTTTPDGVRLVPLERIDSRSYRRLDPSIAPPWEKAVYSDPLDPKS